MDMRRDALEGDAVLLEGSLEFVGALIVEDVEFWGISVGLELLMETGPGGGQFEPTHARLTTACQTTD